jgi:hypothetical protein
MKKVIALENAEHQHFAGTQLRVKRGHWYIEPKSIVRFSQEDKTLTILLDDQSRIVTTHTNANQLKEAIEKLNE